jgi:transposase-like protein
MAKRAAHDPEIRAAAIAALLAGQSVSAVAKEYKLPKGTVSNWKIREAARVSRAETQKPDGKSIGDLLVELLEANIRGLINATSVLHDPKWLREQGAAELGTFIGITHDKVMRMLEAMDRSTVPLENAEHPTGESAA